MADWVFWLVLGALVGLIVVAGWAVVRRAEDERDDAWADFDDEVKAHEAWRAWRERERRRPLESWRDDDPAA